MYLLDNGVCIAKKKTKVARKTLEPLYQQLLSFEESPQGKVLQVFTELYITYLRRCLHEVKLCIIFSSIPHQLKFLGNFQAVASAIELYTPGNYVEYPVINHNGKKYEKKPYTVSFKVNYRLVNPHLTSALIFLDGL